MASPFDRLMDSIRPHLPGAVDQAIIQALFPVCEDFFRMSDVWREEIPFTLQEGVRIAELMPFSGRIERLLWVETADKLPVQGATMPDASTGIVVMPYEAQTETQYTAVVSLTVTDPVDRNSFPIVPYDIATKHWQVLMHGALSRMMAQPSKPFTNVALAQFYLVKFNGGTARAKNDANVGNTAGSQRWAFPQTFNRRK